MPKRNQQTAPRAHEAETEITVDLGEADPKKAVQRTARPRSELAGAANDRDDDGASRGTREWADRNKEVRKRLGRVTRTFEQKLAAQQADFQRQLTDERARVDKLLLDRGGGDQAKADQEHEAKIRELQTKLEAAVEKGDSAEQARINVEISRAEGQYWAKKAAAAGVTTREAAVADKGRPAAAAARPGQPTVAGSRFITANEDWWEDPDMKIERDAAGTIFHSLTTDEGFDANDDETYAEIGRRLKKKFPELEVAGVKQRAGKQRPNPDDDEDDDDELGDGRDNRGERRAAVGAVQDRGAASARNRSNRRTLTQQEIDTMRSVDLDPEKNDHVLRFLGEAQAYEAQEGA